jgi:hypothetical protein
MLSGCNPRYPLTQFKLAKRSIVISQGYSVRSCIKRLYCSTRLIVQCEPKNQTLRKARRACTTLLAIMTYFNKPAQH